MNIWLGLFFSAEKTTTFFDCCSAKASILQKLRRIHQWDHQPLYCKCSQIRLRPSDILDLGHFFNYGKDTINYCFQDGVIIHQRLISGVYKPFYNSVLLMVRQGNMWLTSWIRCQDGHTMVSGWCQDGNTSSRTITEVKHLELNQFSDGWPPLQSNRGVKPTW